MAVLLSSSAGSDPSGNHHLPSTRGNKDCLHINILPEQHEDRGEDTGQEHLFCNVQILAGTVLSTWTNAPFKGDSSAGTDDEALSAAQTSLAPLEAWAFGGQPLKNTTATCDSAAYRLSQATYDSQLHFCLSPLPDT